MFDVCVPLEWLFCPIYTQTVSLCNQQQLLNYIFRNSTEHEQALDTLGNTKWRINKRVLSVVESIWSGGGNLAGLVDREDVSVPLILS